MLDPFRLQIYGVVALAMVATHGYVAMRSYSAGHKSATERNQKATDRLNKRIQALNTALAMEQERLRTERQDRLSDALAADNGEECKYDEAFRARLNGLVR